MLVAICFWVLAAFVAYAYVGYPVLVMLLAYFRGRPVRRSNCRSSVSIILPVYNEEQFIDRRIRELFRLIKTAGVEGEVIVVLDGCNDRTAAIVASLDYDQLRMIELHRNGGKAVALSVGCEAARYDVLVFADARQTWAPDALPLLLENFADPQVGAATGDLVLVADDGVIAGVGLYWRYEKLIRRAESRLFSTVGVTGAISAVRWSLFHPIPQGTLLDDVYWPLQVALRGYRVVHDSRAKAYDRLPERVQDEFRRKVRTLTGNFQLLTRVHEAVVPWRSPIAWQFLSHKVFRLVVPWALLAMLTMNGMLTGPVFTATFWAQIGFYGLAALGLNRVARRFRPVAVAAAFVVLNAAAWLAFWQWVLGRASRTWNKIVYQPVPAITPRRTVSRTAPHNTQTGRSEW